MRASDEVWKRLIAEGFRRGMFQACPPEEVLKDKEGRPVLNGAGAVPKEKGGQMLQRFISIFVPLNEVSVKISGDEGTLPYVGQVLLLNVPREDEVIVDSEDLQSAFNLFEMPPGWRGLFCYEKRVPGSCLGLDHDEPTYVALRTVPMGWLSAVGIVQAAIRHLAFKEAGLPIEQEIQKHQPLPEGDRFLLYLDSVDQLRVVSKAMSSVIMGESSAEHKKLEEACEKFGLPRNSSKRLAGAMRGSLQGGELLSKEGVFMLEASKMQMNVSMCLTLASLGKWGRKEVSGVVGRLVFAGAFRRPLLSALSAVFHLNQKAGVQVVPTEQAYDEILAFVGLLPMAYTNVRAKLPSEIHATDASPTGAGSCTADRFKRAGSSEGVGNVCIACRRDIGNPGEWQQAFDCPWRCGARLCSLECWLTHRTACDCAGSAIPVFSERWSGPWAPTSEAFLRAGFPVLPPFDVLRGEEMDVFTDDGKAVWTALDEEEADVEHHAPECKTFSRARGKPFWIGDVWHGGPPALRDAANVMGFPYLKGADAAKVRRGNRMALRSIKRCEELRGKGAYFSFEHPYGSWVWYLKPMVELAARKGVYMAVFSHCCFGGRRKKWTSLLTNSVALYNALNKPDCDHQDLDDYQPYYQGDRIIFPTEEEAEYPWELCTTMAEAMKTSMTELGLWGLKEKENRRVTISQELQKYHRAEDPGVKERLVSRILEIEEMMQPGKEGEHIRWLFRQAHYRGTDLRLLTQDGNKEMVPYPAMKWYWRECLSFKWTQESHINILELQALFTHLRRVVKGPTEKGQEIRLVFVVDSQVIFYAVSKGRSASTRLNRVLRRLMALQIAADVYVYPLWTISAWNYADVPSRR